MMEILIESGVRVVFKGRYNFNVDGILEVEGAEEIVWCLRVYILTR